MSSTFAPGTGTADLDDDGTVEAFVAVTGVVDDVGDVIVPGAFTRTLANLKPKGVDAHDWRTPIARTLAVQELQPGDRRLPKQLPDGRPWPREAGALWVRGRFNLNTEAGRTAYENCKFYGPEQAFSIGYKVRDGGAFKKSGIRYITDLDCYEWSSVLHGANRFAHQVKIKSGRPAGIETKALAVAPARPRARRRDPNATLTAAELAAAAHLVDDTVEDTDSVLSTADVDTAASLADGADEDPWAEVNGRDLDYIVDGGARLQVIPGGSAEEDAAWSAVPCAGCGTTAAYVRGRLPSGSGVVCRWCASSFGAAG